MNTIHFEKLHAEGLISDASLEKVASSQQNKLFSLHWELRTMLYLGVLLLSGGLGILVYKNIDTIGHTAILIFIGAISAGGFFYCFTHKETFTTGKVQSPNAVFDYVLLLACLSFVTFIGYLQYQYQFFGNRFGLVTFIPMLVLFFCAYYFDHLGILTMAITNLCAWAGIVVTPSRVLADNDFNNTSIVLTGLLLGASLVGAARASRLRNFKAHFAFTYTNFGMHLLFICTLAGMFIYDKIFLVWFVGVAALAYYFYLEAIRHKSFYTLLVLTLYGYIGLSYLVIRLLTWNSNIGGIYFTFLYFIGTAVALIVFLIRMNKKIKSL